MVATDGGSIMEDLDIRYSGGALHVLRFDKPLLNAMLYAALCGTSIGYASLGYAPPPWLSSTRN